MRTDTQHACMQAHACVHTHSLSHSHTHTHTYTYTHTQSEGHSGNLHNFKWLCHLAFCSIHSTYNLIYCVLVNLFRGQTYFFLQILSMICKNGMCQLYSVLRPRSGELRTQKLKSHLVRTQSLNVLLLKSGVGRYIAIHAMFTARNFFLAYFYPSGPFTCIFSKTSPNFFLCWLWLTLDPV